MKDKGRRAEDRKKSEVRGRKSEIRRGRRTEKNQPFDRLRTRSQRSEVRGQRTERN